MTLLIRVRVKAKVWALARCDAHSFLAMWTIFGIIALCCGDHIGLYRIISVCTTYRF